MKPYVRGKTIFLREVTIDDSEFIVNLRTDPKNSKYISSTEKDVEKQKNFISDYLQSETDYYFIISNWDYRPLGTVRIYDVRGDSFCWGSWILLKDAQINTAIESALLIYDFAFFSLHYTKSHFDVRKENQKVVDFHKLFGACVVSEDDLNLNLEYTFEAYLSVRKKWINIFT